MSGQAETERHQRIGTSPSRTRPQVGNLGSPKVAMPPKRIRAMAKAMAKARAKAKAKAKPKAKPKAVPKAAAKALAKAGGRPRRGLRRPAAPGDAEARGDAVEDRWARGEVVDLASLPLEKLGKGVRLVMDDASYFTAPCQVAGVITGVEIADGEVWLRMKATGTTQESLLKIQSGAPDLELRVRKCPAACGKESVGDAILHGGRARLMKEADQEEGWVRNLEKVTPVIPDDDMPELRAAQARLAPVPPGAAAPSKEDGKKERKDSKTKREEKDKDKDKKAKSSKKKKKDKKKKSTSGSSESKEVKMDDGRHAKASSTKATQDLFKGTGLDDREKVRARVIRRARKAVRKKVETDSSSSTQSSSMDSLGAEETTEETLFNQDSKIKLIASRYPGALCAQGMMQMRSSLFQEVGLEDQSGSLRPAAMAYYRQVLMRKVSGPAQRELVTLCTILDLMVRGRAAAAADVAMQRLKSSEATANGGHWTVSQKMEVVPAKLAAIAGTEELSMAQKTSYSEAKAKQLAAMPDGRGTYGKGGGKFKSEKGDAKGRGKEGGRKGKQAPKGAKDDSKTS